MSRAKRRPAIILGGHAVDRVDRKLTLGMAGYQTTRTVLVAPYYSVTQDGTRSGYNKAFVERIRRAEYPDFAWDRLPIEGGADGSVLRLNQLQPVGTGQGACELTTYKLSGAALRIMDGWLNWLLSGELDETSALFDIRQALAD
ncbi:MAG: hypothetical protein WEF50_00445 [Myxococcota bacterium]